MIVNLIVQTIVWFGAMGAVLFLSAGTLDWPAAWVFLGEMVAISVIGSWLLARHDPALLAEQLRPPVQKEQPLADKVLMSLFMVLIFVWLAFMGLDAVRFRWSSMPIWLQALGALALLLSIWICFRTMLENSFAAPVIKIQEERGQRVISTGPYTSLQND
jgi:protein-S-isoprenylcysteine O-methyltransferase Ste14